MNSTEKYKLMSRAERRVAIAKDVIASINAGKFCDVDTGDYVITTDHGKYGAVSMESIDSKRAKALMPKCQVCACGAMMLCRVAKFNGVAINTGWLGVEYNHTARALKDAFSRSQLDLIEAAFERWGWYVEEGVPGVFGSDFDDPEDRLIAIMQNIVDHKGTFRPEVRYEMKVV